MKETFLRLLTAAGLALCLASPCAPQAASPEILGVFRFDNATPDTAYNGFSRFLGNRIDVEKLVPGFEARTWNLPFSEIFSDGEVKRANLRIAVSGSFTPGADSTVRLRFKIMDLKSGVEEEKSIPVGGEMEIPDMAQIVVLKIKDFLSTGMLGKLNISSTPLGLSIAVDSVPSGITPKEFFLPAGAHSIRITGRYLRPFLSQVDIQPGQSLILSPEMDFKGYPTKYWLIGAAIAAWEAALFWRMSDRYYREYQKDDRFLMDYRYSNYIKISMLSLSGIGWIGAAYCYYSNKSLKKRIFALKD